MDSFFQILKPMLEKQALIHKGVSVDSIFII